MQKYISTSAGIIIIFVAVIIAFSGVFAYQYFAKSQISNSNVRPNSNVQNLNTETAGWKTYTDANHSIFFKYPSNFVIESSDGKNVNLKLISGYSIEFSIIDNLPKKDESGRKVDSGKVLSEIVLINGNRFIKNYYLFYGGMGGWDGYIWNYIDRGDGNLYKFSIPFFNCFGVPEANDNNSPSKQEIIDKCLSYQKNNEGKDPMKTMNQILSTFKFTTSADQIAVSPKKEEIVGFWSTVLASSFGDSYNFFPSGKYGFKTNGMDCESRDRGHSGYWKIKNDKLILTVVSESKVVGGILVPAAGSCASKYQISGGEEKIYLLETPKTYEISITTCFPPDTDETDPYNGCFSFDDSQFDKYTSNPYDDNYYFEINEPIFEE